MAAADLAETPAGPGASVPSRPPARFRPLRLALGLALAGAALWLVLRPGPERLEIAWRLEEAAPPGRAAAPLAAVRPGQTARLVVALRPASGAPAGTGLICDAGSRPRVRASAPEELAFERAVEHLGAPDEAVELVFTVDRRARPGPRTVVLVAEAELSAAGRSMRLPAAARREVTVEVGAAETGK